MRSLLFRIEAGALRAQALYRYEVARLPTWEEVHSGLLRAWVEGGKEHHEDVRLIRSEDTVNWIVFFSLFTFLIFFDNMVLHARDEHLSFKQACLYSTFWLCCAAGFCGYIAFSRGTDDAFDWATGYLLEWLLSVDNLFVFRSIFLVFKTPDEQKHKPLFWGIVGAVIFRMGFFAVEEVLVHTFWWMYMLLGAFLVYTGFKILLINEDDDDDPSTGCCYQTIISWIPYADSYSKTPRFFDYMYVTEDAGEVTLPGCCLPPAPPERQRRRRNSDPQISHRESSQPDHPPLPDRRRRSLPTGLESPAFHTPRDEIELVRPKLVATRLFLVVICLEVTDIVFAVDSVSAIVAQIPDLFLAYTAAVFAMLGLRATFFVVDELVKLFTLLPYAVAGILIFIGLKLMLKTWLHIPPEMVCVIIVTSLALSILLSVMYDRQHGKTGCEAACEECAGPRDKEDLLQLPPDYYDAGQDEKAAQLHTPGTPEDAMLREV